MKLLKILAAVLAFSCLLSGCCLVPSPLQFIELPEDKPQSAVTVTAVPTEATEETTAPVETTEATTAPVETTEGTTTPEETTVPPTTEPAPTYTPGVTPTTEVIATGNGYRIIRADHSYRNGKGQVLIEHYYDYVELTGNYPGAQAINATLKQAVKDFLWTEEELRGYIPDSSWGPSPESPYLYTSSSQVTYISDTCLCVNVGMEWYMGGVFNAGDAGFVFDLQTGQKATLVSLAGGDPEALEAQLKATAWEQMNNDPYEKPWDGSYERLYAYTLDTFNYAIVDGQIVLYFAEYEFFSGAYGPVTIYTGIYV